MSVLSWDYRAIGKTLAYVKFGHQVVRRYATGTVAYRYATGTVAYRRGGVVDLLRDTQNVLGILALCLQLNGKFPAVVFSGSYNLGYLGFE